MVCPGIQEATFGPPRCLFVLYRFCNILKSFIHAQPRLSRCLEKSHVKFFGQFETLLRTNHFGFPVTFGSHQQFLAIRGGVLVDLLHPLLHIIKSYHTGTIIAEHDALSALVVGLSDGSKSFLARSIPNLEFNVTSVNIHCLNFKIDACHKLKWITNL